MRPAASMPLALLRAARHDAERPALPLPLEADVVAVRGPATDAQAAAQRAPGRRRPRHERPRGRGPAGRGAPSARTTPRRASVRAPLATMPRRVEHPAIQQQRARAPASGAWRAKKLARWRVIAGILLVRQAERDDAGAPALPARVAVRRAERIRRARRARPRFVTRPRGERRADQCRTRSPTGEWATTPARRPDKSAPWRSDTRARAARNAAASSRAGGSTKRASQPCASARSMLSPPSSRCRPTATRIDARARPFRRSPRESAEIGGAAAHVANQHQRFAFARRAGLEARARRARDSRRKRLAAPRAAARQSPAALRCAQRELARDLVERRRAP